MESLKDILKKRQILTNTSRVNTGPLSGADSGESPECPVCQGLGFFYPRLPSGRPDFSRTVTCRCRQTGTGREKLLRLEQYSNLGALSHLSFEALVPSGKKGDPESQRLFTRAFELAKAFAAQPGGWLVLLGPTGSGKTHLACAIANHRLKLGHPVYYIGASDLLDHLRGAFTPSSEVSYDELFERVRNTPLLVLDDLSLSGASPWAKDKLEQLLNHRFNLRLPTVITTDVPDELDERVKNRLTDPDLCQLLVLSKRETEDEQLSGMELSLLRQMTFSSFDHKRLNLPVEQRENLEMAFRTALNFAQSPEGWLVFQGVNGCGKTHLAAAIANFLLQAGKPVSFVVVPDLLDHLRSAFSPDSKVSYDELFEKVKRTLLLILDDFGEQTSTPWAQEKLYQLMNYRYNARLPTVITTCSALEEIEGRMSSRMVDPRLSLVYNITAPDFRGDLKTRSTIKPDKFTRRRRP